MAESSDEVVVSSDEESIEPKKPPARCKTIPKRLKDTELEKDQVCY